MSAYYDEWLRDVESTAAQKERERIIELLTPIRQRFMGKGLEEEIVADTLGDVINLIKGETNE